MEQAYRQSTRALGGLLFLIGVAMIASTIARGGGPLTLGVVLGAMLALVGVGRAYLAGGAGRLRRRR